MRSVLRTFWTLALCCNKRLSELFISVPTKQLAREPTKQQQSFHHNIVTHETSESKQIKYTGHRARECVNNVTVLYRAEGVTPRTAQTLSSSQEAQLTLQINDATLHAIPKCSSVTNTTATFVAVVDPGTRISFLFARCPFSVFCYLLISYGLT